MVDVFLKYLSHGKLVVWVGGLDSWYPLMKRIDT